MIDRKLFGFDLNKTKVSIVRSYRTLKFDYKPYNISKFGCGTLSYIKIRSGEVILIQCPNKDACNVKRILMKILVKNDVLWNLELTPSQLPYLEL